MQVQQIPICRFLEGQNKIFTIPVYQRDYAWTKVNCQKLWEDIVDLSQNNRHDHFLGTIVTIGSGFQEYTVIDGQQRLTTVSLIILALHKYLENKPDRTDIEATISKLSLEFLINEHALDQDKKIRLKPNKQDKSNFESLFEESEPQDIDSNIVNNYHFFYQKIERRELLPKELYETFQKLTIVLINLDRGSDDPQLIFESLNSTGVDLTAGDLIRNYILMDLAPKEQEEMYNQYWIKIENWTQNVPEFVRNYLIYKNKVSVKKDDVYPVFKKFAMYSYQGNKKLIAKDLLEFAKIYSHLKQITKYGNPDIDRQLKRLNKIEFNVCHPYLFDVFDDLRKGIIKIEVVYDVLLLIESYAFRKILVDNTTQGLNKTFITFAKEIKKEPQWQDNYLEVFKYILLQKTVSQRFPSDDEFQNALVYKEIYKLQSKNKNFLLESLENFNTAYIVHVDELSIEHIMPQKLTKQWKEALGHNWEVIHKKYLHTLGNLSLTANNSKLSNKTLEKKQVEDYQNNKLALNFKLDDISEWNENTILQRGHRLAQNALKIWPYPTTHYVKHGLKEQIFDLTSNDDFSGSKPLVLYIEDHEIPLKSWRNLLSNLCKFLHDYSPTQFCIVQNKANLQWYFDTKRPLKYPIEFLPNKYVEGNVSANTVISVSFKLCEEMGYPAENISFSIKLTNNSDD